MAAPGGNCCVYWPSNRRANTSYSIAVFFDQPDLSGRRLLSPAIAVSYLSPGGRCLLSHLSEILC